MRRKHLILSKTTLRKLLTAPIESSTNRHRIVVMDGAVEWELCQELSDNDEQHDCFLAYWQDGYGYDVDVPTGLYGRVRELSLMKENK